MVKFWIENLTYLFTAELSLDSSRLGKEIGRGILEVEVEDKGLRLTFEMVLVGVVLCGDWELQLLGVATPAKEELVQQWVAMHPWQLILLQQPDVGFEPALVGVDAVNGMSSKISEEKGKSMWMGTEYSLWRQKTNSSNKSRVSLCKAQIKACLS